ncbi:MAG: hypothetical protein LDL41_05700 [Coleofasciculus sp. S288]|nr:hypothetical protein [Coleofasciculus sp. S288]
MTSFLERYRRGECQQVWDELVALGEGVREEPLYTDAFSVARETMQRTRHNIEMFIPRLESLGYRFGYSWLEDLDTDWVQKQPPLLGQPAGDAIACDSCVSPVEIPCLAADAKLCWEGDCINETFVSSLRTGFQKGGFYANAPFSESQLTFLTKGLLQI